MATLNIPQLNSSLVQYVGGPGRAAAAFGGALANLGNAKLDMQQREDDRKIKQDYLDIQDEANRRANAAVQTAEQERLRLNNANLATNLAINRAAGKPVPREMSAEYGRLGLEDPATNLAILKLEADAKDAVANRTYDANEKQKDRDGRVDVATIRARAPMELYDYKKEGEVKGALGALTQAGYDKEIDTATKTKMQRQAELDNMIPNLQVVKINGVTKFFTSSKYPYLTAPIAKEGTDEFRLWSPSTW